MTVRVLIFVTVLSLLLAGCPPPRGIYHTVEPGQTLYAISRAYGIDEGYVARINHVDDPTLLRAGTRLYIPGADRARKVASTALESSSGTTAVSRKAKPAAKRSPAEADHNSKPSSPKRPPSAPPKVAGGTFDWPLDGEIFRKFSARGENPSKGVEISVPKGTPVRSSAAGRVIYSGNGIRGYGNLIILKHDDSFFTVYGFNSRNLVDSGSFVSKGDRIALAGTPPGGGPSRLYFEIRYGKEPVDPIFYLP